MTEQTATLSINVTENTPTLTIESNSQLLFNYENNSEPNTVVIEDEAVSIFSFDIIGSGIGGTPGKSAYETWLEQGNEGTESDFIQSLHGNEYIHPATHSAEMIDETAAKVFLSLTEKETILSTYIHDQMVPKKEWLVVHNLNKYPNCTVIDSSNSVVQGQIVYLSDNKIKLLFSSEFSGKAYLN